MWMGGGGKRREERGEREEREERVWRERRREGAEAGDRETVRRLAWYMKYCTWSSLSGWPDWMICDGGGGCVMSLGRGRGRDR
jgi:hypothetical protein